MESRYRFSATTPQQYDETLNTVKNNSDSSLPNNNTNRSAPTATRYFHRAPLISPQQNQQHLRSPPPRPAPSYLGPLNQNRSRFLSAWDLTPRPTLHHSSGNINGTNPRPTMHNSFGNITETTPRPTMHNSLRNINVTTPTPTPVPEHYHEGQRTPRPTMHNSLHNIPTVSPRPTMHNSLRNLNAPTTMSIPVPRQHFDGPRTPRPTMHHSSHNINATMPTPTLVPKQHIEGLCILNSCALL